MVGSIRLFCFAVFVDKYQDHLYCMLLPWCMTAGTLALVGASLTSLHTVLRLGIHEHRSLLLLYSRVRLGQD
jgi:hypothetical protein